MSQKDCFEDYIDMPPVFLMDGQISLWSEAERQLAGESYIGILDILHAISYMWDIAHVFYSDDDPDRPPARSPRHCSQGRQTTSSLVIFFVPVSL